MTPNRSTCMCLSVYTACFSSLSCTVASVYAGLINEALKDYKSCYVTSTRCRHSPGCHSNRRPQTSSCDQTERVLQWNKQKKKKEHLLLFIQVRVQTLTLNTHPCDDYLDVHSASIGN